MRGPRTALRTIRLVARSVEWMLSLAALVSSLTGGLAGRFGRPAVDDSGSLDDLLSRLGSATDGSRGRSGERSTEQSEAGAAERSDDEDEPGGVPDGEAATADPPDEPGPSRTDEDGSSVDTLLSRLQEVQPGAAESTGERSLPSTDRPGDGRPDSPANSAPDAGRGEGSADGVGEAIVENARRGAATAFDATAGQDARDRPANWFEDPATFDDGGLSVTVDPDLVPDSVEGAPAVTTDGGQSVGGQESAGSSNPEQSSVTGSGNAGESETTGPSSPATTTRVGALAERTIEAASDARQAIREETADGVVSGGVGLLTRTLRRGPGGPGSLRRRFARWRMGRPFWGGLVMLLSAGFIGYMPFWVVVHLATVPGSIAFVGVVFAILVGLSGAFAMILPRVASFFGAAGMSFAILSIVGGALGGMFVGTVVGIVGGAMVIAWEPPEHDDVSLDADPEV